MKAGFFKRLLAYVIDIIIVTIISMLITMAIPRSETYDDANDRMNELFSELIDGKVTPNEYTKEYKKTSKTLDKESVVISGIGLLVTFGYFVVYAYFDDGKTLGKKIMKIKVKGKDGKLKFVSMLGRGVLIYGVLSKIIIMISLYFLSDSDYYTFSTRVTYIEMGVILLCGGMILYTKNKNGLHDIITKTEVIMDKGD